MLNFFSPPDEYQIYPTPQELSLRSSYITLTDFITLLILVQVRRFLTILHYNMKTCSFEFCTSYKLENNLVTTFRNSPLNHSLSFFSKSSTSPGRCFYITITVDALYCLSSVKAVTMSPSLPTKFPLVFYSIISVPFTCSLHPPRPSSPIGHLDFICMSKAVLCKEPQNAVQPMGVLLQTQP